MLKLLLSAIGLVVLAGCMPNQCASVSAASDINISHMSKVHKGMNQAQVLQIMNKPYNCEVFTLDDATYDVWFYITNRVVLGQSRMVPYNLTPLTFKNGILIGRGYIYYNYLKNLKIDIDNEKQKEVPKTKKKGPVESENKQFENLLKDEVPPSRSSPVRTSTVKEPATLDFYENIEENTSQEPKKQEDEKKLNPLSMSSVPRRNPQDPERPKEGNKPSEPAKVPLDEEDEDMFQQEREQDFNQT